MTRLWAKREEQIHGVLEASAGMYRVAGNSRQEPARDRQAGARHVASCGRDSLKAIAAAESWLGFVD